MQGISQMQLTTKALAKCYKKYLLCNNILWKNETKDVKMFFSIFFINFSFSSKYFLEAAAPGVIFETWSISSADQVELIFSTADLLK